MTSDFNGPVLRVLLLAAACALAGCAANSSSKGQGVFETKVDSYTYNSAKTLKPGNYVLAQITDPGKNAEYSRYRSPYIAPMQCVPSLQRAFDARGFKRVYNQKNADYIVWFMCDDTSISISEGLVATPEYRLSSSTGSSNSVVTSSDGNQYRISSNSTGLIKELSFLSMREQTRGIGSVSVTVTVLEISEPFSRKLRFPVWSGESDWVYREPGVVSFIPFETLVSNLMKNYDAWEDHGKTVGNIMSELPPKIYTDRLTKVQVAEIERSDVNELGYSYALTKDDSYRTVQDVSGQRFAPWQVYSVNETGKVELGSAGDEPGLVITQTLRGDRVSTLGLECINDKVELFLEATILEELESELTKMHVFKFNQKRPFNTATLERVEGKKGLIKLKDPSASIIDLLATNQGSIQGQVEFYIQDIDETFTFRGEGIIEAAEFGLRDCALPKSV